MQLIKSPFFRLISKQLCNISNRFRQVSLTIIFVSRGMVKTCKWNNRVMAELSKQMSSSRIWPCHPRFNNTECRFPCIIHKDIRVGAETKKFFKRLNFAHTRYHFQTDWELRYPVLVGKSESALNLRSPVIISVNKQILIQNLGHVPKHTSNINMHFSAAYSPCFFVFRTKSFHKIYFKSFWTRAFRRSIYCF